MMGGSSCNRGSALEHVGKRPMNLNQRSPHSRSGSVRTNKVLQSTDDVIVESDDPRHQHHPLHDLEGGGGDDDEQTDRGQEEEAGRGGRSEEHHLSSEEEESWSARPLLKAKQWRQSRDFKMAAVNLTRSKDKQSVLSALLPGAEIRDAAHPVLVNTSTSNETVRFNIGGTMFETYRSTLHKLPHSPLADDSFLKRHYQEDKQQYFFDRDPEVFGAILNYLRTGELHLPTKYCGPAVKAEIEFWGIEEDEIEECCWTNYSGWTTTLEALRKLEKDRKVHMPGAGEEFNAPDKSSPSVFRVVQMKLWEMLNHPQSSIYAQAFSYVSLTFVVLSIFSFVAQTHRFFRIKVEDEDVASSTSPPSPFLNLTAGNGTANETGSGNTTSSIPGNGSENDRLGDDVHPIMMYIDAVCLAFFLVEFVIRFTLSPRKCKLLTLPMTIFEILALLPDLIEFGIRIFHPGMRNLEAVNVITFLRLLRVFRIFRLMRHFPGLWILFYTLKASVKELLLLLMFLCVGMLFFASLIYYTDDRETFSSIPLACWWAIITMTTVGYGDMHPTTEWGYLVGSCTAICGVLVIGFTVPVLVNNFILYYQHTQCALNRDYAKKRREILTSMRAQQQQSSSNNNTNDAGSASARGSISSAHKISAVTKPASGLLASSSSMSSAKCNGQQQEMKMKKLSELYTLGLTEERGGNPAGGAAEPEEKDKKAPQQQQQPQQHEKKNGSVVAHVHSQIPTVAAAVDNKSHDSHRL